MKKSLLGISISIVAILLTCLVVTPLISKALSASNEIGIVESSETQSEVEKSVYSTVTSTWGWLQPLAVTETGAFELIPSQIENKNTIVFYDFDALEKRSIGAVNNTIGGATPVVAGEKLYVFKQAITPLIKQGYKGEPAFIQRFNFEGKEEGKVVLSSNQTIDYGMVAYDDNDVLFVVDEWNDDDSLKAVYLCEADFESEKLEIIALLNDYSLTSIVGTYQDGLVLQTSCFYENKNGWVGDDIVEISISLFSLKDNKLIETKQKWIEGERTFVVDNGTFYFNVDGKGDLYSIDLFKESSPKLITEGLNLGKDDVYVSLRDELRDGHLTYTIESIKTDEINLVGSVSISTGEVAAINLPYYSGDNDNRLVSIYGETNNAFLILCGMRYETDSFVGLDGVEIKYDRQVFDYALISKSDYWSTIPNYAYIK